MNPTLDLFTKNGLGSVRVITRDSGFWFVAKDVAGCIGYENVSQMCSLCRESDRFTVTKLGTHGLSDPNNHTTSLTLISEPGLYRILAKCRLPRCEPFEEWVFDDVLPSIRSRGVYATPQAVDSMTPEELMAKAVLAAQDTIARLQRERDEAVKAKSQISAGREATLMNRCGNQEKKIISLTKENAELKAENIELREKCGGPEGWRISDIPWIRDFFLPMPRDGEFNVPVQNRLGGAMRKLGDTLGVHPSEESKVHDRRTGHRVNVWPRSVVDEMKRHLDTKSMSDPYVRHMTAYFRPAVLREILDNDRKEET